MRDHRPIQTRLTPFFSNLLPEGPLRDYVARRAGIKPMREYPLMEVLGLDLPGAVTVRRLGEDVADDEDDHEDEKNGGAGGQGALRFSLAGVQLKFSAVEKARGGLTIPTSGRGGDWIIKLPSIRFRGVAANEFSMMRLARAIGLDVPDVELVTRDQIDGLAEVTLDEIGYMAAKAGLPESLARDTAIEAVDRFHEVWLAERAHLPIADDLAAEIERLLGVVPLARNR